MRILIFFFYFSLVCSFSIQDSYYQFFKKPMTYDVYSKDACLTIQSKYKIDSYKIFFNTLQNFSNIFVKNWDLNLTRILREKERLEIDWDIHLYLNIFAFLCLEGKSIYNFNKHNKIKEHFISFKIHSFIFPFDRDTNSICCKKKGCTSSFQCKPKNYNHPLLKKPIRVRV